MPLRLRGVAWAYVGMTTFGIVVVVSLYFVVVTKLHDRLVVAFRVAVA